MSREAGILMPVSSLPGPYGIGDLGETAYAFVDCFRRIVVGLVVLIIP